MRRYSLFIILLCACLYAGCSGKQAGFTLTVAHVNDTHGHLDSAQVSLPLGGSPVRITAGGFPRLATQIAGLRSRSGSLLFLHAGDLFQGTPYFAAYGGLADRALLGMMGLDAMTLGNHEFDKGPGLLSDFIDGSPFPILSANVDLSAEPLLRGKIAPYSIKNVNGERVGIIGLTTPATPRISSPGRTIAFRDPEEAARQAVAELTADGVHAVIVLSHLGYEHDTALAGRLPEIDIIVGGHSHTLLGDFRALGLDSTGPYPTVCKNADNDTVLIVQAWEWARVVGSLSVTFDRGGRVSAWSAAPVMPLGTLDAPGGPDAEHRMVSAAVHERLEYGLARSTNAAVLDEDHAARTLLDSYAGKVAELYRWRIASAKADIVHERLPGTITGVMHSADGSSAARLVASAMLWKMRSAGSSADAALLNAGAVRSGIAQGDLSAGQVYELLPFGDTLVVCRMSGADLRRVLEEGLTRALSSPEQDGAFPYTAGLGYTADLSRPPGQRLLRVELQTGAGQWRELADSTEYGLVTSSYLAEGGDGYDLLASLAADARNTGFFDAEVFIEYASALEELAEPAQGLPSGSGH